MDTPTLKTLLAAQDQAYRGALELFMKEMNENYKTLQSTVQDLKTSLEFSQLEIDQLKQKVNQLQKEKKEDELQINKLSTDLQVCFQSVEDLKNKCNYQEDYNRRNNLQFVGIQEDRNETWEQSAKKVCKLLEDRMQLPNVMIERAHRVGQHVLNKDRPIIARFTKFADREAIMRNVSKLRGSRIYINEDLCPASQEIRKLQLPLLKQAKASGKIAYFRHTKLIIKERNVAASASASDASGLDERGAASAVVSGSGGGADLSQRGPPLVGGGVSTDAAGAPRSDPVMVGGDAGKRAPVTPAHGADVGSAAEAGPSTVTGGAWGGAIVSGGRAPATPTSGSVLPAVRGKKSTRQRKV